MKRKGRSCRNLQLYLSSDLCREILRRLPVKDLLRFRLVCKTWRSIIDDPLFVSLHLIRYKNNVDRSRLFVLEWRTEYYYPIIRRSDTFRKVGVSDGSPLNKINPYHELRLAGYVNGLFVVYACYECTITVCMVWNPSIRKHFTLPRFPRLRYNSISLGFGFDPSNNDYKIVAVCQHRSSEHSALETTVYLYTFGIGSWRVICVDRFPLFSEKNVFTKGVIYWVTESDIFSFDVGKEMFSRCNVGTKTTFPVILGESLALLSLFDDHCCLWVRDQYANWIMLRKINEVCKSSFMYLKMNGEMLFTTDKRSVCSYDINTDEIKVLAKSYREEFVKVHEYVESLVWPW